MGCGQVVLNGTFWAISTQRLPPAQLAEFVPRIVRAAVAMLKEPASKQSSAVLTNVLAVRARPSFPSVSPGRARTHGGGSLDEPHRRLSDWWRRPRCSSARWRPSGATLCSSLASAACPSTTWRLARVLPACADVFVGLCMLAGFARRRLRRLPPRPPLSPLTRPPRRTRPRWGTEWAGAAHSTGLTRAWRSLGPTFLGPRPTAPLRRRVCDQIGSWTRRPYVPVK